MARIYVNCGNYDKAIDELEYVLSLEAIYTANDLKLLPWIEPLRDHPRFQAMMQKYSSL